MTKTTFKNWYTKWNVASELPQSDDAWGLVAIAAKKVDNKVFVSQWLQTAERLRPNNEKWNILNEAVYQALKSDTPTTRIILKS